MQSIKVMVSIAPFTNPNDFYLQWDYIFWWQVKFNYKVCISMINEKIEKNIGW